MSDPVKVKLTKPVEHNGKTYEELTFREATVGDLMAADHFKGDFSRMAATLASISDVPLPAFRKISAGDMALIMANAGGLVGNETTPSMADGDEPPQ